MKKNYHVISHTHWDREWYEPFEQFRVRLVRLMDNLLDLVENDPRYIFHLDAQTIIIEDYLTIKPRNRERLRKAITQGNILIGPWYVQNDLFLTGGEATVRNLLLGQKLCREFGSTENMVGYTPDHFGQPSQLPQILQGFGIDSLIFGRGRNCTAENGKKAEFFWRSPDGSTVLAVQMVKFYNNAQRFSADMVKARGFLELIKKGVEPFTSTGEYLLMNGVDHLEPQENLLGILEKLQSDLPKGEKIFQGNLYDFVQRVRRQVDKLELKTGEMREGSDRWILQGTIASRVYLKVANVRSENFLARQLEVLNSMLLMLNFAPGEYDRGFLDYLWKLLIENQPHDSICGCSCDAVHRHMLDRHERFLEAGNHLLREKLELLGAHLEKIHANEDYYILAVNTLPSARSTLIEATLDVGADEKIKSFKLVDDKDREVPYAIVRQDFTERPLRSPINLPGRILVNRYQIRFVHRLPALGYQVFTAKVNQKPQSEAAMKFENKHLKIKIHNNGQIDLTDKLTRRQFKDILYLEDTADYGDAYTYHPDEKSKVFTTRGLRPRITRTSDSAVETSCQLTFDLRLPRDANFKKRQRSKTMVTTRVEITLSLCHDSPWLEMKFKIDNRAKDHLLRAVIRTGISSNFTQASGMFDVIERDKFASDISPRADFHEPAYEFVKIQNRRQGGVAILLEGLHGYENYRDRQGEIGISLLRATGYINGYSERPMDPAWLVPENQCLRKLEARLAIMPGAYCASPDLEIQAAVGFLNMPLTYSDSCNPGKFSGGRPCVQDSELSEIFFRPDEYPHLRLPAAKSLCSINNPALVMTALKQSEDESGLVLRIYNNSGQKQDGVISMSCPVDQIESCTLAEKAERALKMKNTQLKITVPPKKIITLKFKIKGSKKALPADKSASSK